MRRSPASRRRRGVAPQTRPPVGVVALRLTRPGAAATLGGEPAGSGSSRDRRRCRRDCRVRIRPRSGHAGPPAGSLFALAGICPPFLGLPPRGEAGTASVGSAPDRPTREPHVPLRRGQRPGCYRDRATSHSPSGSGAPLPCTAVISPAETGALSITTGGRHAPSSHASRTTQGLSPPVAGPALPGHICRPTRLVRDQRLGPTGAWPPTRYHRGHHGGEVARHDRSPAPSVPCSIEEGRRVGGPGPPEV
jgi:hypothetical protein